MKLTHIIISVLVILGSCNRKSEVIRVKVTPVQFTETDIFDKDKILDFVFDNTENSNDTLKLKSRIKFLSGMELFVNNYKPKDAIEKLVESILIFPDAKTYFELGNAYSSLKYFELAKKAYEVSDALGMSNNPTLKFKLKLTNIRVNYSNRDLSEHTSYSDYLMEYYSDFLAESIYNRVVDSVYLWSLPEFKAVANRNDFKELLRTYAFSTNNSINNYSLFDSFVQNFPLKNQTFEIGLNEVGVYKSLRSITFDYKEFIPEMENADFGRDVSHDFFYVAKMDIDTNYKAIIYTSVNYYEQDMQPTQSVLAIFNKKGEVVSKKLFACQCSPEKIKTGRIDKNEISISEYKRIWEKPITEVPFEENKVLKDELLSTSRFVIDDTGKIKENLEPKDAIAKEPMGTENN